jgi:hypothetical protein
MRLFLTRAMVASAAALAGCASVGTSAARADFCDTECVLFTLDGVALGNGSAEGTFVWNAVTNAVLDVNITTTSATGYVQGFDLVAATYTSGAWYGDSWNGSLGSYENDFEFYGGSPTTPSVLALLVPQLDIYPGARDTLADGYYGSLESQCGGQCFNFVGSGSIDASPYPPTPLPSTFGMMMIGLAGLGFVVSRQRPRPCATPANIAGASA